MVGRKRAPSPEFRLLASPRSNARRNISRVPRVRGQMGAPMEQRRDVIATRTVHEQRPAGMHYCGSAELRSGLCIPPAPCPRLKKGPTSKVVQSSSAKSCLRLRTHYQAPRTLCLRVRHPRTRDTRARARRPLVHARSANRHGCASALITTHWPPGNEISKFVSAHRPSATKCASGCRWCTFRSLSSGHACSVGGTNGGVRRTGHGA